MKPIRKIKKGYITFKERKNTDDGPFLLRNN